MTSASSDDIYLRLMAPRMGAGDFSPLSFLMTTSFGSYDFTPLERAARISTEPEMRERFQEMLAVAPDRNAFLWENSVPVHEKRHFFDFLSTTYGMRQFLSGLLVTSNFTAMLWSLAERGRRLRLPLRYWARRSRCPAAVRTFVDEYRLGAALLQSLFAGSPMSLPLDTWPGKATIECARIEVDGEYRPMIGYRGSNEIRFYPVNPISIFEGLAVAAQLRSILSWDQEFGDRWLTALASTESHWYYTSAFRLANSIFKGEIDLAVRALEFGLMTPLPPADDPAENDPGMRFYALGQYLLTHPDETADVNLAADRTAELNGWRRPREVLAAAVEFLNGVKAPGYEACQIVLDNYRELANKLLAARADSPLMGLEYIQALGREVLPPVHRKLRPNGSLEMFGDPVHGDAWFTYLLMNCMAIDAAERTELHCPVGFRLPGTVQPGPRQCSCDMQPHYQTCLLAEMVDELRIKFES